MVKGFLKSTEGVFQLSPSATVIGRENCDYIIQSSALEQQHALIEYSESEYCYVLQDLNTAHGTYVNDCRVQNASVRLAPGDIIRFGYAGVPHELEVEDAPLLSYPSVQQRPAWGSSGLRLINDSIPVSAPSNGAQFPTLSSYNDPTQGISNQSQLPVIPTPQAIPPTGGAPTAWNSTAPNTTPNLTAANVVPRPPRPRPSSAGSRRGSSSTYGVSSPAQNSPNNSPLPTRRASGGWVSSAGARTIVTTQQGIGSPTQRASPINEVMASHDKIAALEQRLLRMGDEINRLAIFESESQRKDGLISQLRAHMEQIRSQVHNGFPSGGSGDAEMEAKVQQLDGDIHRKQLEINALKEQMSRMRVESGDPMENVGNLRSLLHQRDRDLVALRQETERSKKDRAASNSLVTTLQRDASNKDGTINRMKGEMEIVKRELREKEVALSAMSAKFSRVRENKKHEEEMAARNKDLISLKHLMSMDIGSRQNQEVLFARDNELAFLQDKLKGSENQVEEISQQLAAHKEDVDKLQTKLKQEKEANLKAQSERDHAKTQFFDAQRSEQTAKSDVEQAQKRMERFRSRIQQCAFSSPGFKVPDEDETEITDDVIVDSVKKLLDERTVARTKVREMKDSMKSLETAKKELKNSSKTLKQHLTTMEKRLSEDGRTSNHLLTEIKCLQSVTVDEHFQGVRDSIAMGLQNELTWQQGFENALEKCGFDIKTSAKTLPGLIEGLYKELETIKKERVLLKSKLDSVDGNVRQEMTQELQRVKTGEQQKITDAVEKAQIEGERKLQAALEELRQSEKKKREEALQADQEKLRFQERNLEQLRQALTEKTSGEEKMQSIEKELQNKLEEYSTAEANLKEDARIQREQLETQSRLLQEQLVASSESQETQAAAFKEQLKQQAMTMVNMEDKLSHAVKDYQEAKTEVSELRKKLHDQTKETEAAQAKLREKPKVPPKPIIVQQPSPDIQALEQLISLLKKENGQLKKEIQEQQDIILGLRRDLAGASARLSDMKGELSEKQKEELENNRSLIKEQEAELTTQRQQLVKLSELVDKKTKEMEKYIKDLGSQKDLVNKHKKETMLKADELAHLQKQLKIEQDNKDRALEQVQQEGLITSEMSAQGAQCRGERHDQVIARQREALAELRSRIKGLETNRPPLPTHDQALQQVILLKKELAEMRAKQAQMANLPNNPDLILDKKIAQARGQISVAGSEAAIERSARVEIQESMDKSERSYLDLAQSVGALLGLGEVPGHETMAHLPRDERERVAKERSNTHELIISRLRTLNQRLERKDQLLKDYEKDLEKLRLAEAIANEKANQVENLAGDVRGRAEEAQYLRETLRRTRESLDKEKRLNSAIKSKKTFHLENDQKNKQTWPKHKCYHDDTQQKQKEQKKKVQKQKVLKKEYEVTMLKAELQEKDLQLCDTTARLINLENSVAKD